MLLSFWTFVLWFTWALFRAVGARRGVAPIARPPTCETCGYNLVAAAADGRCPECGEPVADSLGPGVRAGTLWQRRHEVGAWHAWWQCAQDITARPTRFGRQVQATTASTDHRRFLMFALVAVFVIGAAGANAAFSVEDPDFVARDLDEALAIGVTFGSLSILLLMALVCTAAGAIGSVYALLEKRNLTAAATQMAAYLSGYLVLWAVIGAATASGAITLTTTRGFRNLAQSWNVDVDTLAFVVWLSLNAVFVIHYYALVWRATAAARYANR